MAIVKPLLSKIWAKDAVGADLVSPTDPKYNEGWLYGEKPPNGLMNWLQWTFSKALAHLNEYGVLEHDLVTSYPAGAMVWKSGKVYKARLANSNQSTSLTTYWQEQSLPDMPTATDGYILYYSGSKLYWKSHFDLNYGAYEGRVASTKKSFIMVNDNTIGNDPLATEINIGELACNFKDRTLFTKTPEGAIIPLSGQASIVDFEFTSTAGQTTFSPAGGYTVNQIEVFANGRKLGKSEYTANNGVDVIITGFTTVAGDLIVVSVWASFGLSDAYTQAQTDALLATLRADRAGVTFDFAGATAPTGSLQCNGQAVLKADYPELYAAIGDVWATTGGVAAPLATEFRLPPQAIGGLGLFTRGIGAVGIGVYQADVFKSHTHRIQVNGYGAVSGYQQVGDSTFNAVATSWTHDPLEPTGDATETRPRSITMMKCIWTGK